MKVYNVDVNVTQACTFGCNYCFATSDTAKSFYDNSKLIQFLDKLLASKWYKENYDILNICFWGGEPTLGYNFIVNTTEYFSKNDKIKLFLFTNGYKFSDEIRYLLYKYREHKVDIHPKLCTQISYDGMPIHDIYRRTKANDLTSYIVKEEIKWLNDSKIPFIIKSTVTPETFKYMYEAYSDIKQLVKECSYSYGFFKNLNYFPTIDQYAKVDDEDFERYCTDLKKSLIKIAREENEEQYFFRWFIKNRALCSAGKDQIAIDIDGKVYTCHACLYDDKEKHYISDIEKENSIEDLERTNKYFSENIDYEPQECKECEVDFCLKCNHAKFSNSHKKEYLEKWRDYTNQKHFCEFYKINDKVRQAKEYLRRGGK
jgi:radical SAM protein with 4Fe4S-binding SPASM domain